MKNKMVRIIIFFIVVVAITGVGAATTSTYSLTHSNANGLNNSVNVNVIVNNTANTISVQLVSWPSGLTPLGIDQFFYNIDNPIQSVNDIGWTVNKANAQADGFGTFLSLKSQDPAGDEGISSPLVFTLQNPFSIPITPNDHSGTIAVHIRYATCSGWISDGFVSPGSQTSDCSTPPPTQIPEFPSIALPVSASIGLVFFFYYRKRKEEQE